MTADEARQILKDADLIFNEQDVNSAVKHVAEAVTLRLADANPLVIAVMGGATIFAGIFCRC